MRLKSLRLIGTAALLSVTATSTLTAQSKAKQKASAKAAIPSAPSIVGAWAGTATVPLKDSTIVVPVMYTFTQSSGTVGGMAMVPGQGTGAISNFVRDGARVQFRVSAPEGKLLEHDGKVGSDGAIEGMVNLDKLPIAKFRITQKPK